jgi:hypothetical protein
LERLTYPLDMSRRFEARWRARLETARKSMPDRSTRPMMKTRERIEKVTQVLETRRAKTNVRASLALAHRKEAEAVERRQHPEKAKPMVKWARDKIPPSTDGAS